MPEIASNNNVSSYAFICGPGGGTKGACWTDLIKWNIGSFFLATGFFELSIFALVLCSDNYEIEVWTLNGWPDW